MRPFEKCPVCGEELIEKKVEKLLRGGSHAAVVSVDAELSSLRGATLLPGDSPAFRRDPRQTGTQRACGL